MLTYTSIYDMIKRKKWRCKFLNKRGIDTSKRPRKVKCYWCGKIVERPRCRIRRHKHFFCNFDCYRGWLQRGNYIASRQGSREARRLVSMFFKLKEGYIAHHIDGNQNNNDVSNLMVFKNQKDHLRFHREIPGVKPLWSGSPEK